MSKQLSTATCLKSDPGNITNEENFIKNNLCEVVPIDRFGKVTSLIISLQIKYICG